MLCDRCGKNPSVIQITGEGSYCADCNNQMMLELFGKDNRIIPSITQRILSSVRQTARCTVSVYST